MFEKLVCRTPSWLKKYLLAADTVGIEATQILLAQGEGRSALSSSEEAQVGEELLTTVILQVVVLAVGPVLTSSTADRQCHSHQITCPVGLWAIPRASVCYGYVIRHRVNHALKVVKQLIVYTRCLQYIYIRDVKNESDPKAEKRKSERKKTGIQVVECCIWLICDWLAVFNLTMNLTLTLTFTLPLPPLWPWPRDQFIIRTINFQRDIFHCFQVHKSGGLIKDGLYARRYASRDRTIPS